MNTIIVKIAEQTKYEIQLLAVCCGADWQVTVVGGTRHHIGAVALACGKLPHGAVRQYAPATSTLVLPDHKDDEVAKKVAKYLAEQLHCNVCVSAGIHIDDAKKEELQSLLQNVNAGCEELLKEIQMVYSY